MEELQKLYWEYVEESKEDRTKPMINPETGEEKMTEFEPQFADFMRWLSKKNI